MITLLIKSSFVLIVLWAFYKLFLEKESFFAVNRVYLLTCLGLMFLLPFITLPKLIEHQGYLTTLVAANAPISNIEIKENLSPVNPKTVIESEKSPLMEVVETEKSTPVKLEININTPEKTTANQSIPALALPAYALSDWLIIFYLFGVLVLTLNLVSQLGGMVLKIIRNTDKIADDDGTIVNMNAIMEPCSFFNYIFINPASYDFDTYEQIIAHEKIHVQKGHTWDLLLAELAVIVLWFNPFIWLLRKEVEKNIEYQTDHLLVNKGGEAKEGYQMNLLKIATYNKPLTVVTNYNQSLIKQRILKMNSKQSNPYSYWKYAFIMPLLLVIVLILNKPKLAIAKTDISTVDLVEKEATNDLDTNKPTLKKEVIIPAKGAKKEDLTASSQKEEGIKITSSAVEQVRNSSEGISKISDCEKLLNAAEAGDLDKVIKILSTFDPDCMPNANLQDYKNIERINGIAKNGGQIYLDDKNELILVEARRIFLNNHPYDLPNDFGNEIDEDCAGISKALIKGNTKEVKEILMTMDKDCIENSDDPDEVADLLLTQKILRNGGQVSISTTKMTIDWDELVLSGNKRYNTNKSAYSTIKEAYSKSSANDKNCKTLLEAVRANDLTKVKTLLKTIDPNCVDPNPGYVEERVNGNGQTWRWYKARTPIVAAARNAAIDMVKFLVKNGAKVSFHSNKEESALIAAAEKGQLDLVEFLLINGAELNELSNGYGSALIAAAKNGHDQLVKLLIAKGANINAMNNGQGSALNAAARNGHTETAALLIKEGANINAQNNGQGSALNAAARNGHFKTVELLIAKGSNIDAQTNGQGSALNAAARNGHFEIVELLIAKGLNIDAENNGQGSALNAAARNGHTKMVKLLLDKGADINIENNGQGSALNAAVRNGHTATVELLLAAGADINAQTNGQGSALNAAARNGHVDMINLLLEKGADIDVDNNGQGSALNAAARNGHFEIVELLIAKGANINAQTNGQGSALNAAARNGHIDVAKLLLAKDADVNRMNNGQGTALMQATKNRHYQMVELLLKNGADPYLNPRHQESPMTYAHDTDNQRLLDLFKAAVKQN